MRGKDKTTNRNTSQNFGVGRCPDEDEWTVLPKITESGTPTMLPSAGIPTPNVDGFLSPRTGPSSNAFCTSSEDVLTAFNFAKVDDDDGAFAYTQINNEETQQNSPKVTLVCGDLFRSVCRNGNTLASILLEPQNRVLLQNFLEDFKGSNVVNPWAVGASLKHWARKFSLMEEDTEPTADLPYLKTTQSLSQRGEVDDLMALDRLEKTVSDYLEKLDAEGPFRQAVHSLGTFVDYLRDSDATDNMEENTTGELIRGNINASNVQQAYEEIVQELRLAEAEILELQGEALATTRAVIGTPLAQNPSDNMLLHRIAGFDSFVGIATPSLTEASVYRNTSSGSVNAESSTESHIPPLVFPTRSGMLASGFRTPSRLTVINDSQHQFESTSDVSLTLLASTSSRHCFTADVNGNPAVGSNTMLETSPLSTESFSFPTHGSNSSNTGQEIADEIVLKMWNEDPRIFELACELERSGIDTQDRADSDPEFSSNPFASTLQSDQQISEDQSGGSSNLSTTKSSDATPSPKTAASPAKGPASLGSSTASPKKFNVAERNKAQTKTVSKAPVVQASGRQQSQTTKFGKDLVSKQPVQRGRSVKPQIAFGRKASQPLRNKSQASQPTPVVAPIAARTRSPYNAKVTRKNDNTSNKLANGCRRIEFTKVKQTVSYRQLNKENLKLLHQSSGSSSGSRQAGVQENLPTSSTGNECAKEVVPAFGTRSLTASSSGWELARLVLIENNLNQVRDVHTAPQSSCNITAGIEQAGNVQKMFSSTPTSFNNSRIPSLTKVKPLGIRKSKPALGYAELRQQKKCLEQAKVKKSTLKAVSVGNEGEVRRDILLTPSASIPGTPETLLK